MELVAGAVRAVGQALYRRRSPHLFTGSGPGTLWAQPRISGGVVETGNFGDPPDSGLILRPVRTLGIAWAVHRPGSAPRGNYGHLC